MPVLQKLVTSYNNSYHRSIKTKPALVNKTNEGIVWKNLYKKSTRKPINQSGNIVKGDHVRISKAKQKFEKGYLPNWTQEIFDVKRRKNRDVPIYELVDEKGEAIKGSFYDQEVQKVNKAKEPTYRVEKVLKKRTRGGKKQYFVKFLGYPASFNEWVDELDKEYYN